MNSFLAKRAIKNLLCYQTVSLVSMWTQDSYDFPNPPLDALINTILQFEVLFGHWKERKVGEVGILGLFGLLLPYSHDLWLWLPAKIVWNSGKDIQGT